MAPEKSQQGASNELSNYYFQEHGSGHGQVKEKMAFCNVDSERFNQNAMKEHVNSKSFLRKKALKYGFSTA